jgi:hypothetical protein
MSPTGFESSIADKRAAADPHLTPRGRFIVGIFCSFFCLRLIFLDITSKTRYSIHNL